MTQISVIDRIAVCAVADEISLMRQQMPQSVDSNSVLDAVTRFQLAVSHQALIVLEIATRELLTSDVLVVRMATIQIQSSTSEALADVLNAADVLMEVLQSTHDKVLATKNLSADVRVRKMADVVIAAARNLYNQVEVCRQIVLESEAESDIEAGRLRKFDNATAAIGHLKRLQSAR